MLQILLKPGFHWGRKQIANIHGSTAENLLFYRETEFETLLDLLINFIKLPDTQKKSIRPISFLHTRVSFNDCNQSTNQHLRK